MEQEIVTTAIININPKDDMVVLSLLAQADGLLRVAKARVIATDEGMKLATDDMAIIAGVSKALAEKKEEYYRPVKAHLDAITAAFQTLMAPILEADRITRGKWTACRNEQARKKAEADELNRKRQAEADETNRMAMEVARRQAAFNGTGEITVDLTPVVAPPPVEAPAPIVKIRTDLGTAQVTHNWKFEVVDSKQVPDDYKMVDLAKLGKVVRAGLHVIPGCRIWDEEGTRVTPARVR